MATYRPLPEGLTIDRSEIDGLGLFTAAPIARDTNLGAARVPIMVKGEPFQLRTPLGAFVNHSADPNCVMARGFVQELGGCIVLVSLRDIEAGEELTVTYTLQEYEGAAWL